MRSFAMKTKNIMTNNRALKQHLIVLFLCLGLISYFTFVMFSHETSHPIKNFDQFSENSSFVPLQGQYKDLLHNDEDEDSKEQSEEDQIDEENESEQEEETESSEDEEKKDENSEHNVNENEKNTSSKEQVDEESNHIELVDNPKNGKDNSNKNEYFTTTIVNEETVTEPDYSFRIIQKKHDFTVLDTEVSVNDQVVEDFAGFITLKEGENNITITVEYAKEKNKTFTVTKSYTVYLNTADIIIYTTLEDEAQVKESEISFTATAQYQGEELAVKATVNKKTVKPSKENNFNTTLKEGPNEIKLAAKHKNKVAIEDFIIYYEKEDTDLIIETDLENKDVTNESFSFYAIAKNNDEQVPLTTKLNGEQIEDDGNGEYVVTLKEGKNKVHLIAKHNGQKVGKEYTINYREPDGGSVEEEVDSNIFIEFPDLTDGETIRNSVHTFHVKAVDESGKQISDRGISISARNNGEKVPIDWNNGSHVSFTLSVVDGSNYIEVTAKDNQGNTGTANITVYGDIASDDEPIGTITFSLEASTVGLGHIIPSQEVELYPNERGSYTIDRIFEEYGITYDYTGSHSNSFYLSRIYKSNLVANPSIPEDLAELVERDFSVFNPNNYDPNSLGEFDFSNGSGWMYSVNGHYPNVGFADYYFKDGDVVRIRFTIALGNDIGGGMPGSNYGKEW